MAVEMTKFSQLYRNGAHKAKLWLLRFLVNQKNFNIESTVLLTGSPRSGTTWLGSIINAHPDYCMITEPFRLNQKLKNLGFTWRTYRNADDKWATGHSHIFDVFQGKGISQYHLIDNQVSDILNSNAIMIKSVRLNRLLPWLVQNFRLQGQVLLVRHPCAVISSQLLHNAFEPLNKIRDFDMIIIEHELPHLIPFIKQLKSEPEYRAVQWALDQYICFNAVDNNWLTVSYEQLVANGNAELKRISDYLNLELKPAMIDQLEQPSREAQKWSVDPTQSIEERLSGWKQRLDEETIDRILYVVDMFGIKGFNKDIVPDTTAFQKMAH